MAVKIKLKRLGKIREPYYRIVVADARTKRDGRAIEEIGKYHPKAEPSLIEVNSERVQHWLSVGAQPTDPVRVLLKITGDWQKFTGEPGAEGTLRTAEPRADKKERFTAAAKESQAGKEPRKPRKAPRRARPRARRPSPPGAVPPRTVPAKDRPPSDGAGQGRCGQGQLPPRTVPPRPARWPKALRRSPPTRRPPTAEAAEAKPADARPPRPKPADAEPAERSRR